jgi:hypothetical protein
MRLESLTKLPYEGGGTVRAFGNWAVQDFGIMSTDGVVRTFARRFTCQGVPMVDLRHTANGWELIERHIGFGYGSASEQKGVNRILRGAGIASRSYRGRSVVVA